MKIEQIFEEEVRRKMPNVSEEELKTARAAIPAPENVKDREFEGEDLESMRLFMRIMMKHVLSMSKEEREKRILQHIKKN